MKGCIGGPTEATAYKEIVKVIRDATRKLTPKAVEEAESLVEEYFSLSLDASRKKKIECERWREECEELKKQVARLEEKLNEQSAVLKNRKRMSDSKSSENEGGGAAAGATVYRVENEDAIKNEASGHNLLTNLEERLKDIKENPTNILTGNIKKIRRTTKDGRAIYRVKINWSYRLLYTVDEGRKTVKLLHLFDHDAYNKFCKKGK